MADEDQQIDPREEMIQKYLASKFAGPSADDLAMQKSRQDYMSGLQSDQSEANLSKGLQNAAAAFSGGRYKPYTGDLDANNAERQGQIGTMQAQDAMKGKQDESGREMAVKEYLEGKRHNEQMDFAKKKEEREQDFREKSFAEREADRKAQWAAINQTKQTAEEAKKDAKTQSLKDADEKLYTEEEGAVNAPGRKSPLVIKAEISNSNIDNALKIFEPYGEDAQSLNKMPQAQVNLLTEELGKIANGSVGSEGSRHAIARQTFKSNLNSFLSKVDGQPRPAELGAFLADQQKYLHEIKSVNDNILNKHIVDTHEQYKNRYHSPEIAQRFQTYHANAFSPQTADNPPDKDVDSGPGTAMAAPMPKVGSIEDGHKYLGGDPADQASWEAVK